MFCSGLALPTQRWLTDGIQMGRGGQIPSLVRRLPLQAPWRSIRLSMTVDTSEPHDLKVASPPGATSTGTTSSRRDNAGVSR
jgi:hypothetical protein